MLLGILGPGLLGNLLAGKGARAMGQRREAIRAGDGRIKAGKDFQCRLILWLVFKYKDVTKMNPSLLVCTQKIIYLL